MTPAPPLVPIRQHAGRLARAIICVSIAAPLVTPLIHAAVIRWPATGAAAGILEVIWTAARQLAQTDAAEPAPATTTVPEPRTPPD